MDKFQKETIQKVRTQEQLENELEKAKVDIANIIKELNVSVDIAQEILDEVKGWTTQHSQAFANATIQYK